LHMSALSQAEDPDAEVKEQIEEIVIGIENLITEHNGVHLGNWCSGQRRHLDSTAAIENTALALQEATTTACIEDISEELDKQTDERSKAIAASSKYRDEKDRELMLDLEQVAESHAQVCSEIVCECTSQVRAIGEAWDANAWDRLDRQFGAVSWQQARMVHAQNPTAGVADVYTCGALNEFLQAEKEGWVRSQQNDLERLTTEIQNEADHIFMKLQEKLKRMAPEAILVKPWIEKLCEMVALERDRLKALEQEATSAYESEVDAATWQCSEDYHGYDSELQRILCAAWTSVVKVLVRDVF